jgi:hypothetical protein
MVIPLHRERVMRFNKTSRIAAMMATLVTLSCVGGEGERAPSARAAKITSNTQLIGGPAARAEVGDYLLENDKVRFIIQDKTYNRGAGLFGGSLIDADLVRNRTDADVLGGRGQDTFGELFPAFFLEVIDPQEIVVVNDGSDGGAAAVEVRGKGGEFITLLRLFNQVMVNSYDARSNVQRGLRGLPPALDTQPLVELTTRYTLEPGARHVRIDSTIRNISLSKLAFPNRSILNLLASVLNLDLGDFSVPTGHVLGFGKLSKVFLPGIGYDLQFGLQDAYKRAIPLPALPGHQTPIVGSSSREGVSYGFAMGVEADDDAQRAKSFVYGMDAAPVDGKPGQFYGGTAKPDDMLFLFYASGFGGVFTHRLPQELAPSFCAGEGVTAEGACEARYPQASCNTEACQNSKAACIQQFPACREALAAGIPTSFTYTNYLLLGDGDVSSLWDELYKIRGQKTHTVKGRMIDPLTSAPVAALESFLIYKGREGATSAQDACAEGQTTQPTIWSQVFTKSGGVFELELPDGRWCTRAASDGRPLGPLVPLEIKGADVFLEVVAPPTGHIDAVALDETGLAQPSKVTVVGVHPFMGADKSPREFLFDLKAGEPWRTTDFVPDVEADPNTRRYIETSGFTDARGRLRMRVRPGTYDVYISRGPEYEVAVKRLTVKAGGNARVQGVLRRSVKTPGYLSADLHMHARGSIDSGLDYTERVLSIAAEGLEVVVATDHNYISDYEPFILASGLQPFIKSVIGLELTTFEAGHFNGFPLRYDVETASRGSFEWQDRAPGVIFEQLRQMGTLSPDDTIIQVNHARDSLLGYFSQHNVDPFSAEASLRFQNTTGTARIFGAIASPNGNAFYVTKDGQNYDTTFSWNFDAFEVFNGKRNELLRHFRRTKSELRPIYIASYQAQLLKDVAGYDAGDCATARSTAAACDAGGAGAPSQADCDTARADVLACQQAEDSVLEQAAMQADAQLARLKDGEPVIVCDGDEVAFPGHMDDWYNMLNRSRPYTVKPYERDVIQDAGRLARYEAQTYRKYTATGNSDSHGTAGDEPGYPRNYFWAGHDDPGRATDRELSRAIKDHRVIVTNGPFVELSINGAPIGAEVAATANKASATITVRAPSWIDVKRWRLIGNGEIVASGEVALQENTWTTTVELNVPRDMWFVVEVEGDQSMFPVLPPNEIPPFNISEAVGSLAGPFGFGSTSALTPPTTFAITPFAFTNPIWVIADGDNTFTPPETPAATCQASIFSPNALRTPDQLRPLGTQRLDAVRSPFRIHGEPGLLSRPIGSDRRDVRVLFESWGHHNH